MKSYHKNMLFRVFIMFLLGIVGGISYVTPLAGAGFLLLAAFLWFEDKVADYAKEWRFEDD